jgi:hypothetical protein
MNLALSVSGGQPFACSALFGAGIAKVAWYLEVNPSDDTRPYWRIVCWLTCGRIVHAQVTHSPEDDPIQIAVQAAKDNGFHPFIWRDVALNDRTERRGRPGAFALPTGVARPRSLQ